MGYEPLTKSDLVLLAIGCALAVSHGVTCDADRAAAEIRALRAKVDALRKDKERLDWMEADDANPDKALEAQTWDESLPGWIPFRAAIDAAMKEGR